METKTLFKNTDRELRITNVKGEIIVDTKEDLHLKYLKKEQRKFIANHIAIISISFLLGVCLTYNFLN